MGHVVIGLTKFQWGVWMKLSKRQVLLALGLAALACDAMATTIGGTIYRDIDYDAVRDTVAPNIEAGISAVTVRAFDTAGNTTSVTSNASGVFSITLGGSGAAIRLEFETPLGLQESIPGSRAVRRFSADASGIDMGFSSPRQYCQDDSNLNDSTGTIEILYNAYTAGDPLINVGAGEPGDGDWLAWAPYSFSGANVGGATNPAGPTGRVLGRDMGTTWGLAYQRSTGTSFAAGFIKRHVGLGSGGLGGIYRTLNAISGTAATSLWLDLDAAPFNLSFGPLGTNGARGLTGSVTTPHRDPLAFDAVGKQGLGGLALSDDERTLWALNLFTRQLYEIPIGFNAAGEPQAPTLLSQVRIHSLPNPNCPNGQFRPFGVGFHDARVFVGGVCSGEDGGARGDLSAVIFRHVPGGALSNFALVGSWTLNFTRGQASNARGAGTDEGTWNPWISQWSQIGTQAGLALPNGASFGQTIHPQPMLMDLAFDPQGVLFLGFADRFSHQSGNENYSQFVANDNNPSCPTPGVNASTGCPPGDISYEGSVAGDILMLCPNALGTYLVESAGACPAGSLVARSATDDGGPATPQNNGQGPGGGEFFWAETFTYSADAGNVGSHQEISLGGLALNPRFNELVVSVFDPRDAFRAQGLRIYNAATGDGVRSFETYGQDDSPGNTTRLASFGKSGGMGDVELACDAAPTFIGDYVWNDANANGIQDPNETGIAGVLLALRRTDGTEVGRATTDASGFYGFQYGIVEAISLAGATGIGTGTARYNLNYIVTLATAQAPLTGLSLSLRDNGSTPGLGDLRDSDGRVLAAVADGVSGAAIGLTGLTVSARSQGANDSSFDFGFRPAAAGTNIDLQIAITDGVTVYSSPGALTYSIQYCNNGPANAIPTTATLALPSGFSLNGNWTCGAGTGFGTCVAGSGSGLTLTGANLPSGACVTYTQPVTVANGQSGPKTATATVVVPVGLTDANPNSNQASDTDIPLINGDLSVTIDDGRLDYSCGGTHTYVVVVANSGPQTATGATLDITFPTQFQQVNWTTSTITGGASVTAGGSGIRGRAQVPFSMTPVPVMTLPANSSVTFLLQTLIRTDAGCTGNLVHPATVTPPSGFFETNFANNNASDTDVPNGQPESLVCPVSLTAIPVNQPTALSGVVNDYWPCSAATTAAGATSISVGARRAGGAGLNIAADDLVMVIQMQDGIGNTQNDGSYGDGVIAGTPDPGGATDRARAGAYEIVRATSALTGAAGTLNFEGASGAGGLVNSYGNAQPTAGAFKRSCQIVRVARYLSATLSNATPVTGLPWSTDTNVNGTHDDATGGIVALDVQRTLNLNTSGAISADALGFRGAHGRAQGSCANVSGLTTVFRDDRTAEDHAFKGEGYLGSPQWLALQADSSAAEVPGTFDVPDGSTARGAVGNAGGGGNSCNDITDADDQRTGGGGGGNGGAGGQGGDGEIATQTNGGRPGGEFLPANSSSLNQGRRLMFGGGGGAGARSTGTGAPSSGGAGGGAIMIRANRVIGTGQIRANGANAPAAADQGAGGGGAGGSITVLTNLAGQSNFTSVSLLANGGAGGNETGNTLNQGPGGGAGGGRILISEDTSVLAALNKTANGGSNGTSLPGPIARGATPGLAGFELGLLSPYGAGTGAKPQWYCAAQTTPVTLSWVNALASGVLEFETASEAGTLGFNVFQQQADGNSKQVNAQLIAALGGNVTTPSAYRVELSRGTGLAYWIQEIASNDSGQVFGPYPLGQSHGEKVVKPLIDWQKIQLEQRSFRSVQAQEARSQLTRNPQLAAVDIAVNTTGVVRVSFEQLLGLGLDWSGLDANQLRLEHRGVSVARRVTGGASFGPGSALEFYGRAITGSLYSKTAIYTLTQGAGNALKSAQASPGAQSLTRSASARASFEREAIYGFGSPTNDPWYADSVRRTASQPGTATWTVTLNDRVAGAGALEVDLWGGLDYDGDALDHRYELSVNGTPVHQAEFDGVVEQRVRVALPASLLRDGDNAISISLGATGYPTDRLNIDRIAIVFPQRLQARSGRAAFDAANDAPLLATVSDVIFRDALETLAPASCELGQAGCAGYQIGGFSSPSIDLWRLRAGVAERLVGAHVSADVDGFSVGFATFEQAGDRYEVVQSAAAISATAQLVLPSGDLLAGPEADFVLIAHPSLISGLEPLVAARRAEGLRVRVVDVEAIYRQFSGAQVDPDAISKFIREASLRWGTGYVLLVGGDSYDYFNYLNLQSLSLVPTHYRRLHGFVNYGPTDAPFADFDLDGDPDIAIGRFPARNRAELDLLVAKTLRGVTSRSTMLIADRDLASQINFGEAQDALAQSLPAAWAVDLKRVYLSNYGADSSGVQQARAEVKAGVDAGRGLVQFFGHASPTNWSRESLITASAVFGGLFNNSSAPNLSIQWGCWGSYFVQPEFNTMAHALLLNGQAGAAAVIGASALTETSSDLQLGRLLLPALTNGERLGDAMVSAKQTLNISNPNMIDVLLGTSLLGDPTLRLPSAQ